MDNEKCVVSVVCITYNQEIYLRKSIDSMLMQATNFQYEIIIHDDASTDNSRAIIDEYAKRFPAIVKPIYEVQNQYSQGVDFVSDIICNKARGKYIAFCEGDDYWIDENKLQLQYEALEKHYECDMCACGGCTVTEDTEKEVSYIRPQDEDGILKIENVILGGGQYLVTAGLFFRKNIFDNLLPFEKIISFDYTNQIKGALRGGIWYIDRKMAVYRRYSQNSWTNNVLHNKNRLKGQWEKEIAMLKELDVDTEFAYHDTINERLKAYVPFEEQLEKHNDEISAELCVRDKSLYLWGMGRRGKSLEEYLYKMGYVISGVCDVVDKDIGKMTEFNNKIVSAEYVLDNADIIMASTNVAYNDLVKEKFEGKIINFHKYMPYG